MAIEYGNELYDIAESFPSKELYGLGSQLRRAAVSISNNIAEGSGASTSKDFASFLDISIKSTLETVNILYFAKIRKHITEEKRLMFYEEAERLLGKRGLLRKHYNNRFAICDTRYAKRAASWEESLCVYGHRERAL